VKSTGSRLFLGSVLAVVVPALVLHYTAEAGRRGAGLTVPPFGWPRVLVAHLACAVPLGWLVASWVRTIPAVRDSARGPWVGGGVVLCGLGAVVLPGFGEGIVAGEVGSLAALVLRAILALGLVLPWCVTFAPAGPQLPPGLAFGIGFGLAVLPCGLYSHAVIVNRTELAREQLQRERLAQARPVVLGLCELGSEEPFGRATPHQVLRHLDATLAKLERAVERPLAASAPVTARLERATLLVRLNRLDEAIALLAPLAGSDPTAGLFLAGIYRDRNRWAESDELFTAALDHFGPRSGNDAHAAEMCRMAYEGLAFNARQSGRPADAERVLRAGLAAHPTLAAFFHYELGRHHADGGRPRQAARHLQEAARLDPTRYGEPAEMLRRSLLTGPYGCSLPRP
jgi:hypothetical protein